MLTGSLLHLAELGPGMIRSSMSLQEAVSCDMQLLPCRITHLSTHLSRLPAVMMLAFVKAHNQQRVA